MGAWEFSEQRGAGGQFQVVATKLTHEGRGEIDITTVRGAPTVIGPYSDADPFGDAAVQLSFPALGPLDDPHAADLVTWLGYYTNIDIYWIAEYGTGDPPYQADDSWAELALSRSSLTGRLDEITPRVLEIFGLQDPLAIKVWEGFIAGLDFSADATNSMLVASCQGANFQNDRYLQKPFYPPQPWPLEALIADVFDHAKKPHLRTQPLQIEWPDGWKLVVPPFTGTTVYTPVAKPGSKWTGYTSRQTGAWDHALTGFVQDQLGVMLTDERSGVTEGNQWTVAHVRQGPDSPTGRQPVLRVRDRFRTPDFAIWVGQPGVSVRLAGDSTQSENVIYGDGTGVDGTVWRNAVIATDGSRTDYLPLAASREVYPLVENPNLVPGAFVSEAYTKFGTGMDLPSGLSAAAQQLGRDRSPGWAGTITMATDPSFDLPRWAVHGGMTVLLKGFLGTGANGYPLHIASCDHDPESGVITMTVDSRYRDLLTVEEALQRTRDPLTPLKMLQVNRTSVMIEDIQAPWDYNAGSGFIPKASKDFFAHCPNTDPFPYTAWAKAHPPNHYPGFYVKCNANAATRAGRWAGPIPILTSEKGSIIRTEVYCSDINGNPMKIPFHLSIYYVNVTQAAMPRDGSGPSPYIDNAFEKINPATGQVWPAGSFLDPDQSFIIGWGNRSNGIYNRAGFWPGRESDGARPSGLLVDDATWTFDNTNNPNYQRYYKPGQKQPSSAITLYAMFYAEAAAPVYFMGRLFRQNPGVS